MSGYDYSQGMSNRAVEAYSQGRAPLSQITAAILKDAGWTETKRLAIALADDGFWTTDEWHHSGGTWYNKVSFYSPRWLVELWSDLTDQERDEYRTRLCPPKSKAPAPEGRPVKGKYTVWGGSRRRPQIVGEEEFTGRIVGDWISIDGGGRKKASGNHITWSYA